MNAVRASTTLRLRAPCERGERVSRSWRFGEPDRNRELWKRTPSCFGLEHGLGANRRGVSVVRGAS